MKHLTFWLVLLLSCISTANAQPFRVAFLLSDTVACGNLAIDLNGELSPGMPLVLTYNGTPPYNAQWWPTTGVSDPNSLTPILNPTTSTNYMLAVQDGSGQKDTAYFTLERVANYNNHLNKISNSAGCNGAGSIYVYFSEGVPRVYDATYLWNDGHTTASYSNLSAGIYTVTATDIYGCTGTISDTITSGGIEVELYKVNSGCGADLYANVSSVTTPPLSYTWSTGQTTAINNITDIAAGTYSVTVNDANNCSGTATANIYSVGLVVDSIIMIAAPCSSNIGQGCIYASGGVPPYSYLWLNMMQQGQCFNAAGTSDVGYRITDSAGCVLDTIFYMPSANNLSMYLSPDTAFYTIPDSVVMNVVGGTPPFSYTWSPSNDTTIVYYPEASDFFVLARVIDAVGCYAFDTIVIGCDNTCKWPGDANYDGIADNVDLLYIGIGYNTMGFFDYWADLDWEPHQVREWNDVTIDTVNFKHMDCNGDGWINADDTSAILLNYNLQHPRSGGVDEWRANTPALKPVVQQDTVAHNDTLVIDLVLGDALNPASDVYGIAFTINYNPLVFDTTKTRVVFGDSWLGDATDKISISKDVPTAGKLHCALTRIDHANRSGSGSIGTLSYVITTDNINGKDLSYYNADIWISDIKAIDNAGHEIEVNAGVDSTQIEYEITGIHEIDWSNTINLYPNPANDILHISSPKLSINSVSILNVMGETVISNTIYGSKAILNTEILQPGIYFTQLHTDKGSFTKRFMISR